MLKGLMQVFLLLLIITLPFQLNANSICLLTSEEEPKITITMNYQSSGRGIGTMNYNNDPLFFFEVGVSNGFSTQYYHLIEMPENKTVDINNISYSDINHNKIISEGRFVNFINNKIGKITIKEKNIINELKAFMPSLSKDYYYYLSPIQKEGEYNRFNLSDEMKSVLNASEGFFVNSNNCENFFAFG